jgi:hypothetical protein
MKQEFDKAQLIRQMVFFGVEHPERIVEIVNEFGIKTVMTETRGLMDVRRGSSSGTYSICSPKEVADANKRGYTGSQEKNPGKRNVQPPSARSKTMAKAAAAPATEAVEEAGEKDYTLYAGKPATATMQDFADWLIQEGAVGEFPSKAAEAAFRDGVRLGGTLRMDFQKSDFNQERRAERQAARAQENGASEAAGDGETAPKPKATRGAAKAATPKAGAPAAKRGRGRPAATAVAPY